MIATGHIPIVKKTVSEPGSDKGNEDHFGCTYRAAWVVDGVSALHPIKVGEDSAPRWFARCLSENLHIELSAHPTLSTLDLLNRSLQSCITSWRAAGMDGKPYPAATLAMVRVMNSEIELTSIGDCSIRYQSSEGKIVVFADRSVEPFEKKTTNRLRSLQAEHSDLPHRALVKMLKESMQDNRRHLNQTGGYNALTLTALEAKNVVSITLSAQDASHFLITSDGFSRYSDLLGIGSDQQLFGAAGTRDLHDLLKEIRQTENQDAECRKHPRVKKSDDATAIWVEIVREPQS